MKDTINQEAKNAARGGRRANSGRKADPVLGKRCAFNARVLMKTKDTIKALSVELDKSMGQIIDELAANTEPCILGVTRTVDYGPQMQKALASMMSLKGCSEDEALEAIATLALARLLVDKGAVRA